MKTLLIVVASCLIGLVGCQNLSPRDNFSPELEQKIEKIEGNQNTLENYMNSMKLQLANLQNSLNVPGDGNNVQQGWLNVQADGIVIGTFSLLTIGVALFYMNRYNHYRTTCKIMSEQIKTSDDYELKERIMAAAWNTKVQKTIYNMIKQ